MNIYEIRQDMRARHTRISDYNLRVVYYARVSTDKYDQLHSLEAQKHTLKIFWQETQIGLLSEDTWMKV